MDSTTPFRDPLPGALARRRELLSNRRDDFVEMPEAVRRTYVARWGRIGGGMAAALMGSVLLALIVLHDLIPALGQALYGAAEAILPGRRPAVLATLAVGAWLAGGFAWILARAFAERAFARRTTEAALPSDDVHRDIERLAHVTPVAVGQSHALRIEGASVGLPLFGLALLLPTAAIYLGLAVDVGGYPKEAAFEERMFAASIGLAVLAAGGLVLAAALRLGLRSWTTSRLRTAAGAVAGLGATAAVATAILGSGPLAGGLAALMLAGTGALLIVRKERNALGLGDSNAAALDDSVGDSLSQIFGLAASHVDRFVRSAFASRPARVLRRLAASPRSLLRRRPLLLAVGGFMAGALAFSLRSTEPDKLALPDHVNVVSFGVPASEPEAVPDSRATSPSASLTPESGAGDSLVMAFHFDGDRPTEAHRRALLAPPPTDPRAGWRVIVEADMLHDPDDPDPFVIGLSPFRDSGIEFGRRWHFSRDCSRGPVVIDWRAVAGEDTPGGPHTALIGWKATLEACALAE